MPVAAAPIYMRVKTPAEVALHPTHTGQSVVGKRAVELKAITQLELSLRKVERGPGGGDVAKVVGPFAAFERERERAGVDVCHHDDCSRDPLSWLVAVVVGADLDRGGFGHG